MMRTISFQTDYRNDSNSGAGFAQARDFAIDEFKWTTDPTCPSTVPIADPGFERNDPSRGWNCSKRTKALRLPRSRRSRLTPNAHAGTRSPHLGTSTCNETATAAGELHRPRPVAHRWASAQSVFQIGHIFERDAELSAKRVSVRRDVE